MKIRQGYIEEMHNIDGSPRGKGKSDCMCWGSGYRVTLDENAVVDGDTAIISRCPNPKCTVADLKVIRVTEVEATVVTS